MLLDLSFRATGRFEFTESLMTSMMQRYLERMARMALVANLAALHPFSMNIVVEKTMVYPIQSIALLGGFAIALLGLLLVMGTLNWQRKLFQKVIAVLIFGLIIALTSAIANVIQNGISGSLSNNIWSLLIGGALGGIVAGCGGAAIQGIGKLSPSYLAQIGIAFIVAGFFIEFLVLVIFFLM